MGGAKGGSQTLGYKYFMSLLMGLGRGPISELVEIKVGGKTAWKGPLCDDQDTFFIDAAELFGGDEKEGGIYGPARLLRGGPAQVLPGPVTVGGKVLPGVKEMISPSDPMPALRGISAIWFDGEICSLNPYPKEWKVRMRRHTHGWYGGVTWYEQKALIYLSGQEVVTQKQAVTKGVLFEALFASKGGTAKQPVKMLVPSNIKAMNGAHIIYECITNPEWGRGIPASLLDENSFIYAANQLCAEFFGLCFFWTRQEDVDVFIQNVLDHIGGVLYTDRSTGLETLRLIRADYDIDDLPVFSPGHGLLDILVDDSGSQDIAYNEVVVKYHDPITDTDGEARAHNAGARIAQGSTNSLSKEYPGLPTKELAGRIAVRELIVQSAGLKKYRVRLDRSAWRIAPGMPFRVVCPQRGVGSIVLRAGEITDASIQSGGYIEIGALEDVFSMPATSMVTPETGGWTPPTSDPVPPDASAVFEMSYYDLTKNISRFDLPSINDADAYMAMVAAQPLPTQQQYQLFVDSGTGYVDFGTSSFTANAILGTDLDFLDTALTLTGMEHWPDDVIGDSMMIGDERLRIDTYDPVTGEMTVARGVADTLPRQHTAGVIVWLPDDDIASDRVTYAEGEELDAVAATRTTSAVLPEEDWDPRHLVIQGRVGRPYPPADFRVDGDSVFDGSGEHPEPVFTWVPRNRITQEDQLIGQTEGPVTAEADTTYEFEVYDMDGVLLSTHDCGTDLTFTYDATLQDADDSPDIVRVNVVAVRGDFRSLYLYQAPIALKSGYGYAYGFDYGGLV